MTRARRIALLLSTDSFEDHFGARLGLSPEQYLNEWRSGWVWSYCRMLSATGFEPAVYIPAWTLRGRFETPEGWPVRFLELARGYRPWARWPVLRRTPPGRYLAQAANALSFRAPLERALREDGIDALAIQEYWTARFDLLASTLDLPVIAIDQGFSHARELKWRKRKALPRARLVVTQTIEEGERVEGYGARATRIQNGVDSAFFTPPPSGPEPREQVALCVAQLNDTHKRISDLIGAARELPPAWHVELLGSGRDERALRALASELGVADRVTFRGFERDRGRVRERLRRCGVFVLPSAREGLPMALLEAMSCGCAVVGTRIPAIAEVVDDGEDGLLVAVGDAPGLARAILAAHTDRERLGARARATVEDRFSEAEVGGRLAASINLALAPSGVPAADSP